MISCALCGAGLRTSFRPIACEKCQRAIDACALVSSEGQQLRRLSLWSYRGIVRDAILAYKVQRAWCAGAFLVQQLLETPRLQPWLKGVDVVMPMPSSLWGRLRGRYDLAAFAAAALARHHGLILTEAPWRLQGRWNKQALRSRSERLATAVVASTPRWNADYFQPTAGAASKPPCVLVVDDIITSGQSLQALLAAFTGVDFRVLTLASALRSDRRA